MKKNHQRRTGCPIIISLTFLSIFFVPERAISQEMKASEDMTSKELVANFAKKYHEEWRNKYGEGSERDRKRMMNLLNLHTPKNLPSLEEDPTRPPFLTRMKGTNNWFDEFGNLHNRSEWGTWNNFIEKKANNYTLLDPLTLKNGQSVKDVEIWWNKRRPEILDDFQNEIYGQIPNNTPEVNFKVQSSNELLVDNKNVLEKKVIGVVENSQYPVAKPIIDLILYIPTKKSFDKIPLIVIITNSFTRNLQGEGPLSQVMEMGWALAFVNVDGIQIDAGSELNKGIVGLVNKGKSRSPSDWGALAAWSWGLSRAFDYFETLEFIDSKKIALEGISRFGKAAVVAGAYDQRWAIILSSCAGAMGTSLEKRNFGENIDNVAAINEYHWMAGNFLKYAGNWDKLPVDAHMLIALIAPRPIFVTGGSIDTWSDTIGEFKACVAASPVYELLGKKGLSAYDIPKPGMSYIEGDLAFYNHKEGHSDKPDWPLFIDFAKRYFE